jgi:hypothetical protein
MKLCRNVLITLLFMFCNSAAPASPVNNLVDVPVPAHADGSSPKIREVKKAIMAGCRDKGWTPLMDDERQITCSTLVRSKYFAEVEIPYTRTSYSIYYKSSRQLGYDEKKQKIDRKYNKWIAELSEAILLALAGDRPKQGR